LLISLVTIATVIYKQRVEKTAVQEKEEGLTEKLLKD